MRIDINDIRGLDVVQASLDAVSQRSSNLIPVWSIFVKEFYKQEEEQFDTEGGLTVGWAPLSEKYREWKEQVCPGCPILVLSGRLKRAATGKGGGSFVSMTRHSVAIGIAGIPYAHAHQVGKKGLPRRPFWVLSQELLDSLVGAVEAYLLGGEIAGASPYKSIWG